MQRTNRDMQKTLDRLTAMQTERKARGKEDLEELAALLEHNEIRHLPVEQDRNQSVKMASFFPSTKSTPS